MKDLKSNVTKFNDHISEIVVELTTGSETSSDLIMYVFHSYLSIEDQEFKWYIQNQKEKYDEGDQSITVTTLMSKALTKYNQLIQSKTWKAKSPEEEKLITLTAQLKVAKDKLDELSKQKKKSTAEMTTKKEDGATTTVHRDWKEVTYQQSQVPGLALQAQGHGNGDGTRWQNVPLVRTPWRKRHVD
jgi:hypothetical protein